MGVDSIKSLLEEKKFSKHLRREKKIKIVDRLRIRFEVTGETERFLKA